jgi:hypothetical protein
MAKSKNLAAMIQAARGENYAIHYQTRAAVKCMPAEMISDLDAIVLQNAPFPLLDIFGAAFPGWLPEETRGLIARSLPPSLAHIFNPWYLSNDGWDGFQRLWKALPEPDDLDPARLVDLAFYSHKPVRECVIGNEDKYVVSPV